MNRAEFNWRRIVLTAVLVFGASLFGATFDAHARAILNAPGLGNDGVLVADPLSPCTEDNFQDRNAHWDQGNRRCDCDRCYHLERETCVETSCAGIEHATTCNPDIGACECEAGFERGVIINLSGVKRETCQCPRANWKGAWVDTYWSESIQACCVPILLPSIPVGGTPLDPFSEGLCRCVGDTHLDKTLGDRCVPNLPPERQLVRPAAPSSRRQ